MMYYGSGCINCPVKPCNTVYYRGSTCAAQRAKFGLGDPLTNADRIREMTDYEMATELLDMFEKICEDGVPCAEWMLHWLQLPVEDE